MTTQKETFKFEPLQLTRQLVQGVINQILPKHQKMAEIIALYDEDIDDQQMDTVQKASSNTELPATCLIEATSLASYSKIKPYLQGLCVLVTVLIGVVVWALSGRVTVVNTTPSVVFSHPIEGVLQQGVELIPRAAPSILEAKEVVDMMEISPVQQANFKYLVKQVADCEVKHPNKIHKELRKQFGYSSYKNINGAQYNQIIATLKERLCAQN